MTTARAPGTRTASDRPRSPARRVRCPGENAVELQCDEKRALDLRRSRQDAPLLDEEALPRSPSIGGHPIPMAA